jgi:glycosyltransferase involved in cell wall biosynthesis
LKKILFVINTMGRAGAEKSMTELMKVIDPNRFELHLLVLINRGEMYDEVPSYVKVHNKRIDHRSVFTAKGFLMKTVLKAMFQSLAIFRELPYLIRSIDTQRKQGRVQFDKLCWKMISDAAPRINEKFDVAIAYLEGGAAYYVADHVTAEKKAAFIHTDYQKAGYTPYLDHGCYGKMDQLFIVSEDAKKSFLDIYPQYVPKVKLFHNIIHKEAIQKAAEDGKGFQDDVQGLRILTIARLHYQKAIDLAIAAFSELKSQKYNIRWYVIGEGELKPELEALAAALQVSEDFIFLGARANPYPYLKQCDIYVHATRFEGKSIAIQEAQALGKAIVVSDCSGNRELIQDHINGLVVSLDKYSIAAGIKKLLEDKELKCRLEQENRVKDFGYAHEMRMMNQFLQS